MAVPGYLFLSYWLRYQPLCRKPPIGVSTSGGSRTTVIGAGSSNMKCYLRIARLPLNCGLFNLGPHFRSAYQALRLKQLRTERLH